MKSSYKLIVNLSPFVWVDVAFLWFLTMPLEVSSSGWLPNFVEFAIQEAGHLDIEFVHVLGHDVVASLCDFEEASLTAIFLFHHLQNAFCSTFRIQEASITEGISDWESTLGSAQPSWTIDGNSEVARWLDRRHLKVIRHGWSRQRLIVIHVPCFFDLFRQPLFLYVFMQPFRKRFKNSSFHATRHVMDLLQEMLFGLCSLFFIFKVCLDFFLCV